jgi:predicted DNA-binding protein
MNKEPFTFYIDPEVLQRLKKLADKTSLSAAWHIRQAVDDYLSRPPVRNYLFRDTGELRSAVRDDPPEPL